MTIEEFLDLIKVLNDNTRLTILQMLSKSGTMCACNILEELSITQGTLSHHMKVLVNANLVSVEKDGKWCHYTLLKDNVCSIAHFIQEICSKEANSNKCSCTEKTTS